MNIVMKTRGMEKSSNMFVTNSVLKLNKKCFSLVGFSKDRGVSEDENIQIKSIRTMEVTSLNNLKR